MDARTPFSPSRNNVGKDHKTPSKNAMSSKKPKQQVRWGLPASYIHGPSLLLQRAKKSCASRWTASFLPGALWIWILQASTCSRKITPLQRPHPQRCDPNEFDCRSGERVQSEARTNSDNRSITSLCCAARVCEALGGGLWDRSRPITHSGFQEQGDQSTSPTSPYIRHLYSCMSVLCNLVMFLADGSKGTAGTSSSRGIPESPGFPVHTECRPQASKEGLPQHPTGTRAHSRRSRSAR